MRDEPPPLRVFTADRLMGKTTLALKWVSHGKPAPGYPGWDRVLVLPTAKEEMFFRGEENPDTGRPWFADIEDWSHRVYDASTWAGRRGPRHGAVMIDDLTRCLRQADVIFRQDNVVAVTINGRWIDSYGEGGFIP